MTRMALVTGCSSGIGKAITENLLADGWGVWGVSRSEPQIEHEAFWWVEWDFGEADQDLWALRFCLGTEPFDALIHCAAQYGPIGPFETTRLGDWIETISVNLIGTAQVIKAALPRLRKSDDPRILLFSGGGAFNPRPRYSAYAASKAGVVSLVETLAEELAPEISVNGVSPGFVGTPIHKATLAAGPEQATDSEYAQALLAETYNPEAMARAVACVRHLLSPDTRGLTGKTISAPHDSWQSVTTADVESLNDSPLWTRTRLGMRAAALETV